MSNHVIEDLVMESIVALDSGDRQTLDVRDGICRLYEHQRGFDCSFTQGRVLELLKRRGHTFVLSPRQHPAYASNAALFDVTSDEVTFVSEQSPADDELEVADEDEGYLCDGRLHCVVGTSLWRALVRTGTLPEAAAPRALPLAEVVSWVMEAADARSPLVVEWYRTPLDILFGDAVHDFRLAGRAELEALPSARLIRERGLDAVGPQLNDDQPVDVVPENVAPEWRGFAERALARRRAFENSAEGRLDAERRRWWRGGDR